MPSDKSTRWFLFVGDSLLITPGGEVPLSPQPPVALRDGQYVQVLPDLEGIPCRAAELTQLPPAAGEAFPYRMEGLRAAFDLLPEKQYAMAGKARELLYWDAQTRYCGCCGAPMQRTSDISKRCSVCGKECWPSPAAAVIVAISRERREGDEGDVQRELLLVQSRSFRGDYLGLVAGFVETGETLEEALRREVMEETGLTIDHIRYFASQPWPYPFGLMVGFTARYVGGELTLQRSELSKGGWFTADNLPPIPGRVSLARRLIDHWVQKQ